MYAGTKRRSGQLIPMVAVILVVFGFIAMAFIQQSQTVTSVTGIALYGGKAHQLALSAMDEARLILFDNFDDRETGDAPWKAELRNLLQGQDDGTDVALDKDLSADLVTTSELIADTGNAELVEATLRFHGFHRLNYSDTDAYDNPEAIYSGLDVFDDAADEDDQKVLPSEDWVGYASLQVKVRVRGVERQLRNSFDIKVVDVQPFAREFALFNWLPLTPEQDQAGLSITSLNHGGRMTVWANNGRVFMKGPYQILMEGEPDGSGGEKRSGDMRHNLSYPINGRRWYGWSTIPSPRALFWFPMAWLGGSNLRPKDSGLIDLYALRYPLISGPTWVTNDRANDAAAMRYLVGSTKVGNQTFSVWGEPGNNDVPAPGTYAGDPIPNNGFSPFRGALVKYDGGQFQSVTKYEPSGGLPSDDEGSSIEIEGQGLFGIAKQVEYKKYFSLALCFYYVPPFNWNVDGFCACCIPAPGCVSAGISTLGPEDDGLDPKTVQPGEVRDPYILVPYGLKYMEEESVGWLMQFLTVALDFVVSYAAGTAFSGAGAVGGTTFGTWGNVTLQGIGQAITFAGTQAMVGVTTANVLGAVGQFFGTAPPTAGQLAGNGIQFPPKFKPPLRGATRIHPTLGEALNEDGSTLNLDGIVVVEAMPQDDPAQFTYSGKGMLYTATTGEDANTQPNLGTITPATDEDWLTFSHFVQRIDLPADGGDSQVHLNSQEVTATIYAQEGVTTDQDEATIVGNLVTMTINKFRIPEDSKVNVLYDTKRLGHKDYGGPPPKTWGDGRWTRISISPKVAAYDDRYRE